MKVLIFLLVTIYSFNSYSFNEGLELKFKAEQQKIQLTEDEIATLKNGELGGLRYTFGGVLGTYPLGLGIGHAIQGRWSTQGWKFTATELASVGVIAIGASKCLNRIFEKNCGSGDTWLTVGLIGLIGARIWEIIDVWHGGYEQMENYPYLKRRILGTSTPIENKNTYFILPTINNDKTGLLLGMTF